MATDRDKQQGSQRDIDPAEASGPDDDDRDLEVVEDVFDLFNARGAIDPEAPSTGAADEVAGPASDADVQSPPG